MNTIRMSCIRQKHEEFCTARMPEIVCKCVQKRMIMLPDNRECGLDLPLQYLLVRPIFLDDTRADPLYRQQKPFLFSIYSEAA